MRSWLTLVVTCLTVGTAAADSARLPNVVFILADDLGFNDTTLYGGTTFYKTPNLQRLAARGMIFTHAYTPSPLCSPTRAAILSGQSPARTGITTPACHLPQVVLKSTVGGKAAPDSPVVMPTTVTRFSREFYTLAEALKDAGYATGHFGKWHLGAEPYSPLQNGFDVDVPHWPGPGPAGSYVAPWKFPDFDPDTPNQHIEDRMAQEAVAFMEQHRDEPFFLNYWMFSVHAPFDAKQDLIDKYRPQVDQKNPQRSPTYAAMVESMDDAVGTLLDTLDRLKLTDNTIIVFTSDNGGNMYNEIDDTTPTSNAPLRGGKGNVFEGGIHVPCVVCWKDHVAENSRSNALICSYDFYPTLLDLLSLKPLPGQIFDGLSFTPALNGEAFERDAIFTYFPHATKVPDWLEPSATVHHGDWKLIRIFHSGKNGEHRWKLFNLKDDIGEQNDLAEQRPDLVQELDARLERFLTNTHAVVPIPNPAFDPDKYDPAEEGKSVPKQKAAEKKSAPKKTDGLSDDSPALKGWKLRRCTATIADGLLTITASGNEPFLGFAANRFNGPAKMVVCMKCSSDGTARVQHLPSGQAANFNGVRNFEYSVTAGDLQEIEIAVPVEASLGIMRLYLPFQKTPIQIDWIELSTGDKTERWDF